MISFCKNINRSKLLPFIYRLKFFWRSVNPKNFPPLNKPFKMKGFKNIQKRRTMCRIFRGYRSSQVFMWGGGLIFVFKLKLFIPEIGGYALAEGSHLSVPAPRRAQIFFQVWTPHTKIWSHVHTGVGTPHKISNICCSRQALLLLG